MTSSRARRAIGVLLGLLVLPAPPAVAQIPAPAQVERELATIYRARAPRPTLGHRDPLIDRLEPLLMQ